MVWRPEREKIFIFLLFQKILTSYVPGNETRAEAFNDHGGSYCMPHYPDVSLGKGACVTADRVSHGKENWCGYDESCSDMLPFRTRKAKT